MTPRNHLINLTHPTGRPPSESQPISGTSHPSFWNIQKVELETKTSMENSTGGAINTALVKASGSATRQKTTGSGLVPLQLTEGSLGHQARETATRIWTSPRTSTLDFYPSRIEAMSKPSCTNSASMPRETSRPEIVAQRLPKISKCIPKAINSTPTTDKQINAPSTPLVGPQENLIWHHEDPPKNIFSHN